MVAQKLDGKSAGKFGESSLNLFWTVLFNIEKLEAAS